MTMKMNFPMKLYTVDGRRWTANGGWWLHRQGGRWAWLAAVALLWLPLTLLRGQTAGEVFPPKPDPAVYVHDYSGWLSASEKAMLEEKLRRYTDSTSTQIVVMIRPDIGDYDKSSYAFELGNRWGIGRKSKNNGVVMLIKSEPPDRGIFIATGYGVEGALPDITAGQIIRNTMAPYFRQKQYYQGIDAGTTDIIRALSGEFKADREQKKDGDGAGVIVLIFFIVMILFIIFVVRAARHETMYSGRGASHRPRRRGGDDWWIGGGGWGSGSSGGWGGGSSGGWGGGGGFGGGSFGGGGAGGDW